ncbi:hypothetical protein EDC01DRAFT_627293 [Geopyxis carbonaria]|nr:hypothetical protein EDC01DRAFT_627293 [Geopyxis carbonaria]
MPPTTEATSILNARIAHLEQELTKEREKQQQLAHEHAHNQGNYSKPITPVPELALHGSVYSLPTPSSQVPTVSTCRGGQRVNCGPSLNGTATQQIGSQHDIFSPPSSGTIRTDKSDMSDSSELESSVRRKHTKTIQQEKIKESKKAYRQRASHKTKEIFSKAGAHTMREKQKINRKIKDITQKFSHKLDKPRSHFEDNVWSALKGEVHKHLGPIYSWTRADCHHMMSTICRNQTRNESRAERISKKAVERVAEKQTAKNQSTAFIERDDDDSIHTPHMLVPKRPPIPNSIQATDSGRKHQAANDVTYHDDTSNQSPMLQEPIVPSTPRTAYNAMQSGLFPIDNINMRTIRSTDFQTLEPDSPTVAYNATRLQSRHNPLDNDPQFIIAPITLIISHLIQTTVPQFKMTISAKSSYPDFMEKVRAHFDLANDDYILVYAPVDRSQELLDEEKPAEFADQVTSLLNLGTKSHAIRLRHAHRTEFFSHGRSSSIEAKVIPRS